MSIGLELVVDGDDVTGHAVGDDARPHAFSGWLGLLSTLGELLDHDGTARAVPPSKQDQDQEHPMAIAAVAPRSKDLDTLRHAVAGTVVCSDNLGWDDARAAWNLAVDQQPVAVVRCASADDVVVAVRYARGAGLRVAAQATGHGAGPLAPALDGALLLRLDALRAVSVDAEARVARVGAGARWSDVAAACAGTGLVPLAATAGDVGVCGTLLTGGVSWLARRHGLACQTLVAADVVTPDGVRRRVSADEHPELFWALRGGGGSFGVVVSLEVALVDPGPVQSVALRWPWERASEVLHGWRAWTASLASDDSVTSTARLLQMPGGGGWVTVEAVVLGSDVDAERVLAPLRALRPEVDDAAPADAVSLLDLHGDAPDPTPYLAGDALLRELPAEAIDVLIAFAGPGSASPVDRVELRHLGGALAVAPDGAGALGSLDGAYLLVGTARVDGGSSRAAADHLLLLASALSPWEVGRRCPGFCEQRVDPRQLFPTDVHRRLRQVKGFLDPRDVVVGGHAIAPAV